ncbi:MAG: HU family DNA-binding protein [Syntrophomonadales bacterium]
MNKTELISDVAGKANMTKKDVEKVLSALFSSIEEALKNQDKVQLVGFGTFEVRDRKARTGRNPQTGEEIKIPASRVPAFKAGKTLKDAVV